MGLARGMEHPPPLRPAAQLRAEGWTSYRLRKAVADEQLVRLTRRIYAPVEELSERDLHVRRAAALLRTHKDSVVLSHATAALVHGLAVQVQNPRLVGLTVPPPGRGRTTAEYHLHRARLEPADVVTVGELRVTSLARTVADLARTTPFTWGVVAADQALALGVERSALVAAVDAAQRLMGVEQARRVVAFADGRSESVAESASRVTLWRTGLPMPTPQLPIVLDGRIVARGDFGWEKWNLVGEMDGKVKYRSVQPGDRTPEEVMVLQNQRQERIRQAGFWVTRWGWKEAWNVDLLGLLVRNALMTQGWTP